VLQEKVHLTDGSDRSNGRIRDIKHLFTSTEEVMYTYIGLFVRLSVSTITEDVVDECP